MAATTTAVLIIAAEVAVAHLPQVKQHHQIKWAVAAGLEPPLLFPVLQ
jgi:hypothetical protein